MEITSATGTPTQDISPATPTTTVTMAITTEAVKIPTTEAIMAITTVTTMGTTTVAAMEVMARITARPVGTMRATAPQD